MLNRALPSKATWLNELLQTSLCIVSDYLRITTCMKSITQHPRATGLKGMDRILAICREIGTKEYINLPGAGKDLYKDATFAESGISLRFLQPDVITYRQFDDYFIPMLSILDVIMFNKAHELQSLLQAFSLKTPSRET